MGVWGTGLYSGDFAMDLRSTVGAVVRLPFDADRLVDILCETEPAAANDPNDEEHPTFWLIVADQFAKRGIASDQVRERALAIIDAAEDIAPLAVIIASGRAFDFLSWYRPLTIAAARNEKPTLDSLRGNVVWRLELPGTCSPTHFKKMELETIGNLPVDPEKVRMVFPDLRPGISAAVGDISIANRLSAAPHVGSYALAKPGEPLKGRSRSITGIEQILRG